MNRLFVRNWSKHWVADAWLYDIDSVENIIITELWLIGNSIVESCISFMLKRMHNDVFVSYLVVSNFTTWARLVYAEVCIDKHISKLYVANDCQSCHSFMTIDLYHYSPSPC